MKKILCIDVDDKLKQSLDSLQEIKQHKDWPRLQVDIAAPTAGAEQIKEGYDLILMGSAVAPDEVRAFAHEVRQRGEMVPMISFSGAFADVIGAKDDSFEKLGIGCAHTSRGIFELYHDIHKKLGTRPEQGASMRVG